MSRLLRYRWLLVLLATLLVANLGLLAVHFLGGRAGTERRSVSEGFYQDLGLTPEQDAAFRSRKDTFMREMRPHWVAIRRAKDSLYSRLADPSMDDSTLKALTAHIAELSRQSDERLFQHFRGLRSLCTPAQQAAFDTLVPKLVARSRGGRGPSAGR